MEESVSRDDLFSKAVRAGKRTYFFDVKSTRSEDMYLTITESKKRFRRDGGHYYEKHKLFLYREDFEKFIDAYHEAIEYINENAPEMPERHYDGQENSSEELVGAEKTTDKFTDVEFDDLGNSENGQES